MQEQITRRESLQGAAGILSAAPAPPFMPVKTVYAVFKCHFDIGFTDTQAGVLRLYFDTLFPEAMKVAAALRGAGGPERYVWTVGSWLMSQYLDQATPAQRRRAAQAIADGDLVWQGLPFSWQSEMVDRSLLEASLGLSQALDQRFGTKTTGAKLTDVPGQTRSLVGPLVQAGITFLDIGVNPASCPPDVPPLFRWRDPAGSEIAVLYHGEDYGGTVVVPGSDLAIAVSVKTDNAGVHSVDEVRAIYAHLDQQFPGAQIVAASLSDVAAALKPHRAGLPLVTQEIGDTWIYGCASDPKKIAQYRELSRLRREWIAQGKLKAGGRADRAWISWLILAPEHTWGCDIKTRLAAWNVYTPAEMQAARDIPKFRGVEATWAEKRANLQKAVQALPPALIDPAQERLNRLRAVPPQTQGLTRLGPADQINAAHFTLSLDPETGAICRLQVKKDGREWASPSHPLGLFSYQTFSQADYHRFLGQYLTLQDWWPPEDFGKPGLDKYPLQSRLWHPARQETVAGREKNGYRIVTDLHLPEAGASAGLVAWPERLVMEMTLPDDDPAVFLELQWFGKAASRLPEAMWLSFQPVAPDTDGWRLDKIDQPVDPRDVVSHGSRSLHAVTQNVSYHDADGHLQIQTLDAPLVAPGRMALLDFDNHLPDMTGGIHVNLFNNTWGTNYILWIEDDLRFRFVLRA